ncbi:hypothetical protein GYMLUDRAFT_45328 [Collybiopsis luxurians FD-317 M1]|uniref:Retrotransposon gag domain-containing protein n=1 Tax=Collybiopsis luxurians FD-317 M1 TaxID=944289 RepID=A0A0D0CJG4_9AGAR|nr:hypothetical protein GYMLUDRAFT_45328 [Collybiopsis luxurians FD-317 M1]
MPSFSADLSDSESGHEHVDCSSYLHAFDTQARSHIHQLPDSWNDCDQQPCPHTLENSITEATQLRDGTPAVPIARSITAPHTLTAPPVPLALTAPPASTTVTACPSPASSPAPPLLTSSPSPIPSMSQQSLDQLMHSLIQQSSAEARRFIAHFESWASEQADLKNDDARAIKAALGFLSGGAADWATPYLSAFNAKQVPFNGKWVEFLQAFKLRFESIDPGMEARNAIKKVQQGKGQTVAEFTQKRQPPRQPPRQQVSATSSVPFTLFPNEPAQAAASAPPAASTTTTPNLAVQIAQLQELLNCANAMAPDASCQEDF